MISVFASIVSTFFLAAPATQPASLPADASEREGNRLRASAHDLHAVVFDQILKNKSGWLALQSGNSLTASGPIDVIPLHGKDPLSPASLQITSLVIKTEFPFNDVVPSWNIDVPSGGGFVAQLRVGRIEDNSWSPFHYLGTYGQIPEEYLPAKTLESSEGEINIDYFQSRHAFDRMQYRLILCGFKDPERRIRRVALAYSNTLDDPALWQTYHRKVDPGPKEKWARRLPVPYRSQRWESEKLRGQICSPTSTSMVLEYRGVKKPTVEVCERIFDPEYKMYGNWWRAVQGAYSFGVPGYIERFGDWNAVKKHIAEGQPVIASIKIKRGQMSNFPNRQSAGHLIVITGFTEDGDVCVNDPAAAGAQDGQTTHPREDMEKVWLANGGIGYILEPLPKQPRAERGG